MKDSFFTLKSGKDTYIVVMKHRGEDEDYVRMGEVFVPPDKDETEYIRDGIFRTGEIETTIQFIEFSSEVLSQMLLGYCTEFSNVVVEESQTTTG